ncbi:unnamed protein product, partial [Symbiodinium natans]
MPYLDRPDGAKIYYEVKGSGIPVLLLAPGGMRSSIAMWDNMPWNPWTMLALCSFRLIAMDQRSAQVGPGLSSATFSAGDGWQTFADDQLALLDHLGIEKSLLLGSCIGPSFQLRLLKEAPQRFAGAVLLQPIGMSVHTTERDGWSGINSEATLHWFGGWADEMEKEKKAGLDELRSLYEAMFGSGRDFVFSVSREDVQQMQTPMLVMMGLDLYHPAETAREIARLAPEAELVERWRDSPEVLEEAVDKILSFLSRWGILAAESALFLPGTCDGGGCLHGAWVGVHGDRISIAASSTRLRALSAADEVAQLRDPPRVRAPGPAIVSAAYEVNLASRTHFGDSAPAPQRASWLADGIFLSKQAADPGAVQSGTLLIWDNLLSDLTGSRLLADFAEQPPQGAANLARCPATSAVLWPPPLAAACGRALEVLAQSNAQGPANLARCRGSLETSGEQATESVSEHGLTHVHQSDAQELSNAARPSAYSRLRGDPTPEAASRIALQRGREQDRLGRCVPRLWPHVEISGPTPLGYQEPRVIVNVPGFIVLMKPAGWETDVYDVSKFGVPISPVARFYLLSSFLAAHSNEEQFPISRCAESGYGFIHRCCPVHRTFCLATAQRKVGSDELRPHSDRHMLLVPRFPAVPDGHLPDRQG